MTAHKNKVKAQKIKTPHVSDLDDEEAGRMRDWAIGMLREKANVDVVEQDPSPRHPLKLGSLWMQVRGRVGNNNSGTTLTGSTTSLSSNASHTSKVFGTPLEQLVERLPTHTGPQKLLVPVPVHSMLRYLRKEDNIAVEGLFRVAGSAKRIAELQTALESDPSCNIEQLELSNGTLTSHDVASLLKLYLRSLPEPLLMNSFAKIAPAVSKLETLSDQLEVLQLFYLSLPPQHQSLVEALFRFLHRVARRQNRMDATNLALVFAPAMIRGESVSDLELHGHIVVSLKLMIIYVDDIFLMSMWLNARETLPAPSETTLVVPQNTKEPATPTEKNEGSSTGITFSQFVSHPTLKRAKTLTRSIANLFRKSRDENHETEGSDEQQQQNHDTLKISTQRLALPESFTEGPKSSHRSNTSKGGESPSYSVTLATPTAATSSVTTTPVSSSGVTTLRRSNTVGSRTSDNSPSSATPQSSQLATPTSPTGLRSLKHSQQAARAKQEAEQQASLMRQSFKATSSENVSDPPTISIKRSNSTKIRPDHSVANVDIEMVKPLKQRRARPTSMAPHSPSPSVSISEAPPVEIDTTTTPNRTGSGLYLSINSNHDSREILKMHTRWTSDLTDTEPNQHRREFAVSPGKAELQSPASASSRFTNGDQSFQDLD